MKIILTLVIFIVAFYLMAMVFRRLTQTAQQLADLRSDLAKSDAQLQIQLEAMQRQRQLEAQNAPSETSRTQVNELKGDDQFKRQN